MNEEQKRLRRNENKRKLRAKIAAETPPILIKPDLVVNTDTSALKYKPKKAKNIVLKEKTIITYTSKLRAFHNRMTGLPLSQNIINAIKGSDYDKKAVQDEFKYLYDKVSYIKENELSAIPNICKIFTKITGFVKLIKMLIPIKRNIEIAEGVRRNNTTILQENLISLDKQDLLDNSNKLTDNPSKLLYLLMTILPPRRLDDYRTMTFGVSNGNHFDAEYMYITEANTKNKKSITIKIPDELLPLIPTSGFLLGKNYSQPVLSNRFASIMTQVYGRKIGALQLRRIFLTHFNKKAASFLERKIIADAVGHSVEESTKYSVIVLNNTSLSS
jgi:hypothetical protein